MFANGTIVSPTGTYQGCIGTLNGKISCLSESLQGIEAEEIIDLDGLFVLPGVIDAHIHFQDPGFTHRDDFEHATAACAAGGTTTALSHPMNKPAVVNIDSFNENIKAYEGRSIIDYGLHGGGTNDNIADIGYVDTIGSDHCPFTREEKEAGLDNIFRAPNGIPGLEIMLPVLLNGVNNGHTSLEKIVEITSYNPAKLYGLFPDKGVIQIGADCDLTIVDMEKQRYFNKGDQKSKCDWSPYFGLKFKGWPVMTVVRGTVVCKDDQILVQPGNGNY